LVSLYLMIRKEFSSVLLLLNASVSLAKRGRK
jgi:hypothetical protein